MEVRLDPMPWMPEGQSSKIVYEVEANKTVINGLVRRSKELKWAVATKEATK